jgi:hypothetical protein
MSHHEASEQMSETLICHTCHTQNGIRFERPRETFQKSKIPKNVERAFLQRECCFGCEPNTKTNTHQVPPPHPHFCNKMSYRETPATCHIMKLVKRCHRLCFFCWPRAQSLHQCPVCGVGTDGPCTALARMPRARRARMPRAQIWQRCPVHGVGTNTPCAVLAPMPRARRAWMPRARRARMPRARHASMPRARSWHRCPMRGVHGCPVRGVGTDAPCTELAPMPRARRWHRCPVRGVHGCLVRGVHGCPVRSVHECPVRGPLAPMTRARRWHR